MPALYEYVTFCKVSVAFLKSTYNVTTLQTTWNSLTVHGTPPQHSVC